MSYAVNCTTVSRIARYHITGCEKIGDAHSRQVHWHHRVPDLDSVIEQGLKHTKAVVPADCCLRGSTVARCVGCDPVLRRPDVTHLADC